jgi:hypothetical protein
MSPLEPLGSFAPPPGPPPPQPCRFPQASNGLPPGCTAPVVEGACNAEALSAVA